MPDDIIELFIIAGTGVVVGFALETMYNLGKKYGRRQYRHDYDELLASELDTDRSNKNVGTIR